MPQKLAVWGSQLTLQLLNQLRLVEHFILFFIFVPHWLEPRKGHKYTYIPAALAPGG